MKPESNSIMLIQFHSLYAGLITVVLVLMSRPSFWLGIVVIPVCLMTESGHFGDRLRQSRNAWSYAAVSLLQSIVLFGVYALLWVMLF